MPVYRVTGALVAWTPRDVQKAKAFMQHNLAVAHATRTEYDKAMKYLTEVRSHSCFLDCVGPRWGTLVWVSSFKSPVGLVFDEDFHRCH